MATFKADEVKALEAAGNGVRLQPHSVSFAVLHAAHMQHAHRQAGWQSTVCAHTGPACGEASRGMLCLRALRALRQQLHRCAGG